MDFYSIYEAGTIHQHGRFPSPEAAFAAAQRRLPINGVTKYVVDLKRNGLADLLTMDGTLLYSIGPYTAPSKRQSTIDAKVAKLPPFKFTGRPSASGWLRCETKCELDCDQALAMIEPAKMSDLYYAVYADRFGTPLHYVALPSVMKVAHARSAAIPSQRRVPVHIHEVAGDITLSLFPARLPADVVAVYIAKTYHEQGRNVLQLRVLGKRLTEGLVKVPMPAEPQTYSNSLKQPKKSHQVYLDQGIAVQRPTQDHRISDEDANKAAEAYNRQQRGEY